MTKTNNVLVDAQFGGVDQRKIFMFARECLPKIGYKKRIHFMNPLIPGLTKSGKMSSSEPLSKVDFDDHDNAIRNKFKNAYSVDGVAEGNGLLSILRYIIFRVLESQNRPFVVKRAEKWGGDITFTTYEELEKSFVEKTLASSDLKAAVAEEVINLVGGLREVLKKNSDLTKKAYPPEKKVQEKAKQTATTAATIGSMDIRVGKIVEIQKHPEADLLYVEKIDIGEEQPRTIISGLVKHIPIEELKDRLVLVLCNLPEKAMRGITSQGMVMAASIKNEKGESEKVVLLDVPKGSKPGEKLVFDVPEKPDEKLTNKRLERILKCLKTNNEGVAVYMKGEEELAFKTSEGQCTASLSNANIS